MLADDEALALAIDAVTIRMKSHRRRAPDELHRLVDDRAWRAGRREGRRADRSRLPVEHGVDVNLVMAIHTKIYRPAEEIARNEDTIVYTEVAPLAGLDMSIDADRDKISHILDDINKQAHAEERPVALPPS